MNDSAVSQNSPDKDQADTDNPQSGADNPRDDSNTNADAGGSGVWEASNSFCEHAVPWFGS